MKSVHMLAGMHAEDRITRSPTAPGIPVDDGAVGALRVERAVAELRRGREVALRYGDECLVVMALEMLDAATLARIGCDQDRLHLLITPERADALGHRVLGEAASLMLSATWSLAAVRRLAGIDDPAADTDGGHDCRGAPSPAAAAALELVRQAQLMPALLVTQSSDATLELHRLSVDAEEVFAYPEARGRLLVRVSSAAVPLAGTDVSEFVVYRERFGDAEHVAVVVGSPDLDAPVTVRLHSSCFTGDLFGSLRCDCGEQLQGAVRHMAANGGGVVLYLAQEGRGIGLGNKLRAYRLQDAGFDTIEADRQLGFQADGRVYSAARTMLDDLGISHVRLLTNNPNKVDALASNGISVVERLPLSGTINPHNARYLETKRTRAGHLPSVTAGNRRAT